MAGLIWAGIGKGLSDAGTSVGNAMMRGMERDEAMKLRAQERLEDKEFKRETAAETRAFQENQNAMYRKLAGDKGSSSSGGSGGGVSLGDIEEGGKAEGLIAREAGMSVGEMRALRRSSETGDTSAFATGMTGAPLQDGEMGPPKPVYSYPEGFEKVYESKLKTLSAIEQKFAFGKDYKGAVEGQQAALALDVGKGVIGGTMDAGKGSTAVAAMEGKELVGGNSDVTRDLRYGTTTVTPVGQSQIDENKAQASKARADAATGKTDANTTREQAAITNAERALTDRVDKLNKEAERQFPVSAVDAYNPAKLKAIMDKREAFVSGDKDVIRLRERVESMYAGNSGAATSKPVAKPVAAKPGDKATERKVGTTQVIQAGVNKGKTAKWDGRGWVLAN